MGRIKTALIKRITIQLYRAHPETFQKTFTENKPLVTKFADIPSKKLRNIIAGYVTRLARRGEEI